MLYMVTFTINIPQMLAYIAYMDPMGYGFNFDSIQKMTTIVLPLSPDRSIHRRFVLDQSLLHVQVPGFDSSRCHR